MDCKTFHDYIVNCTDGIQVNAYLTPLTDYRWQITDKFEKRYDGPVTTDADGNFLISVDELPEGLLSQYSGQFTLQVFEVDNACRQVQMNLSSYYDEVCFEVKTGGVYFIKNNIGC